MSSKSGLGVKLTKKNSKNNKYIKTSASLIKHKMPKLISNNLFCNNKPLRPINKIDLGIKMPLIDSVLRDKL